MKSPFEKNLISTKSASEFSGYNSDYLARLCRAGKIDGVQVGRAWLVSQESLEEFVKNQTDRKQELRTQLSESRGKEYLQAQQPLVNSNSVGDAQNGDVKSTTTPRLVKVEAPVVAEPILSSIQSAPKKSFVAGAHTFQQRGVAVLASLAVLLIGVYAAQASPLAFVAKNSLATAVQVSEGLHIMAANSIAVLIPETTFNTPVPYGKSSKAFAVASAQAATSRDAAFSNTPTTSNSLAAHQPLSSFANVASADDAIVRTGPSGVSRLSAASVQPSVVRASSLASPPSLTLAQTSEALASAEVFAVVHPIQSYIGAGTMFNESVQNGLSAYAQGINSAGNVAYNTGSFIRDFGTDVPEALAVAEITPVISFEHLSNSILNGYSDGVYAWVNVTPKVPAVMTDVALSAGTRIAYATAAVPVLAVQEFTKGTTITGETSYVAFSSAAQGMQHSQAVKNGVSQAELAIGELSTTTAQFPTDITNQVTEPHIPSLQTIQNQTENEVLGIAGYASLALQGAPQNPSTHTTLLKGAARTTGTNGTLATNELATAGTVGNALLMPAVMDTAAALNAVAKATLPIATYTKGELIALATYYTINDFFEHAGQVIALYIGHEAHNASVAIVSNTLPIAPPTAPHIAFVSTVTTTTENGNGGYDENGTNGNQNANGGTSSNGNSGIYSTSGNGGTSAGNDEPVYNGVSQAYVDSSISSLKNLIAEQIDSFAESFSGGNSGGGSSAPVNISNLTGTTIDGGTFTNSSFSGGPVAATILTAGTTTLDSLSVIGDTVLNGVTSASSTVTGNEVIGGNLTVNGSISASSIVGLQQGGNTQSYFVATSSTATSTYAGSLNVDNGGFVYATSTRDVGIGVLSPNALLALQNSTSTQPIFVASNAAGAEVYRITDQGFVGIGTTTPSEALSVAGSGYFDGNLAATNLTIGGTANLTNAQITNGTSTNFYATNLTSENSDLVNASTTNFSATTGYISSLIADTASTTNLYSDYALLGNSSTTNAYIQSLFADSGTITDLVGTNSTFASSTANNLYALNATLQNASATNLYASTFTGNNGIFNTFTSAIATIAGLNVTNATTTNATSTNLYSTHSVFGDILATIANFTTAVIGNLTATNANITNATTTNATSTNEYAANLTSNNGTINNLTSGTATVTNLNATNSTTTNATTTNFATTNFTTTNLTGTNVSGTNITGTNITGTNGAFTNLSATNATTTSATSTNFFASLASFAFGTFNNLSATIATIAGLNVTNATTTNATSTNEYAANLTSNSGTITNLTSNNGTINNLTSGTATVTNLNATNSTTTNATTTNFATTNFSSTNVSSTNLSGTNVTGTNITGANGAFTNLTATKATTTNATSTNLYSTHSVFGDILATIANFTTAVIGNLTATNANITNATTTNATSTNEYAANFTSNNANITALTVGNLNGVVHATNGTLSAGPVDLTHDVSNILPTGNGGTGFSTYSPGITLIADQFGNLEQLTPGSTDQVLKIGSNGVPYWGLDETVGGGGNDGIFATSTNTIYPLDTSNIFLVGSNATSSKTSVFEVHGNSYFGGNVGINSTSPLYPLTVEGISSLGNKAIAGYFTATTTTASTFPYASTTALSVSNNAGLTVGNLTGPLQATNGTVSATSSVGVTYGGTGLTTGPTYGKILIGNSVGGYTLSATSSLEIAVGSLVGTTDNLAEGTNNLYFTNARADARIDATTTLGSLTTAPNLTTVSTSLTGFLKSTAGALSTSLINLTSDITGILPVANGGTGSSSFATNGVIYGNSSSALLTTGQGGANTVLTANNGAPAFSSAITVGTSVTTPTLNATTAIDFGGANINTAGTLTNVAYLNGANTFTNTNAFTGATTLANATSTTLDTSTLGVGSAYFTSLLGNGLVNNNGVLTVATTSLGSGFFEQGGNAFGTTATFGTTDTNPINIKTNNIVRATFDTLGNFGIGTTSPAAKFAVAGGEYIDGNSTITGGLTLGALNGVLKATNGVISAATEGTDYEYPLTFSTGLQRTGNVITNSGVLSVASGDGSLTISPTVGNVVANLNTAHANTFTALQTFASASATQLTTTGATYLATTAGNKVGIGTAAPAFTLDVNGKINTAGTGGGYYQGGGLLGYASSTNQDTIFGLNAGGNNATTSPATETISAFGYKALSGDSSGYYNTGVGGNTLSSNTNSSYNTATGYYALNLDTAQGNTANGALSLDSNTSGSLNTGVGYYALNGNTTGNNNTSLGYNSLANETIGSGNIALGYDEGYGITSGNNNVFLGYDTSSFGGGNISSGSNNIGIGFNTVFPSATNNNQLNIGNTIFGTLVATSTSNVVPTSFAGAAIGIGTSTPTQTLSVAGGLELTGGLYDQNYTSGTNGQILQTTGSGIQWVSTSTLGIPGGTVTSVNASGGTTGLSFAGGPITTAGTLTLSGVLGSANGGAGAVSGILKANGSGVVSAATPGTDYEYPLTFSTGLQRTGNVITNSGVLSITNADGSLTISPNTGNAVASLNTANPNTFTALQQFNGNASTTQLTTTGNTYLATTGGNVGIGTTSPSQALAVNGNAYISTSIGIGVINTGASPIVASENQNRVTGIGLQNLYNSNTSAADFSAANAGNVTAHFGITGALYTNTASLPGLTTGNTTYLAGTGSGGVAIDSEAAPLKFLVGATTTPSEMGRFTTTGLGLGTTTPTQTLSVAGGLELTGGLYDQNYTSGTNGQILQTTGSGIQWVSTSTLGFGTGSVTSVNASGGTTGLSFAGGPITTSGTLTLSGVLGSSNGGAGSVSGILKANGSGVVSAATPGTDYEYPLTFSTGLQRTGNVITNSGVLSITNVDGSLTISPNTGNAVASLNTANPNTFSALQQFNGNASTTQLTVSGQTYLASASVSGAANITGTATVGNLINNDLTANTLTYANGSKQISSVTISSPLSLTSGTLSLGTVGVANGGTGSTTLTGLLKGNGTGAIQTAVPGVDYQPAGAYLTGNQTITLSGDVTGSGTTAITTTIGNGKVTNADLAGSIAASKLIGTDISTVGTITTGTWQGSVIGSNYGGAGAINGILKANGSGVVSAATPGTDYEYPLTFSTGLQRTGNVITNSGVLSVSNSDNSLTISPTTGNVVANLNTANPNTFTALQQFNGNASSTQFTSTGSTYLATAGGYVGIGNTSPSSALDVSGNITLSAASATSTITTKSNLVANSNPLLITTGSITSSYRPGAITLQPANAVTGAGVGVFVNGGSSTFGNGGNVTLQGGTGNSYGNIILQSLGGNVGIGTTTPGALFAVAGNGLIGGNLVVSGNETLPALGTSAGSFLAVNAAGQIIATTSPTSGTVTSVNASGGTTGLSFAGGPITTSGTLTLSGVLGSNNGGAGAVSGILKANGSGVVSAATEGTDYEYPLTFSTGLQRTGNVITNSGVLSFNGRVGAVVPGSSDYTTSQIAEGTNLYFTNARADARINATSTIGTLTSAPSLGTLSTSLTGILRASAGVLSTGAINLASADITGTLGVANGGTGSTTLTGLLKGNGTGGVQTAIAGTDYLAPGSLSAGAGIGYNSGTGVISNTGVLTVSNADGSLTITPTSGNAVASLNTAHANTFTALQQFNGNASTTVLSVTGSTYLATTAGGRVGIGTKSPADTLDVNGIINTSTSGGYYLGGQQFAYGLAANQFTAVGTGASPTASIGSSAFGYNALNAETGGGFYNTGIGAYAASNNTSGLENTALGFSSGFTNTSGFLNTSAGFLSLYTNNGGSVDSAFGANSLYSNTSGSVNVAVGNSALYSNTTGSGNIGIGTQSGYNVTTGAENILIGYVANVGGGITTGSNSIGLGYNLAFPSATANNQLNIGNSIFGTLVATSTSTSVPTNFSGVAIGIGTTTPGSIFSIGGVANFATGTSTLYSGLNLASGGCYAVNGVCVGTNSGTVTSVNASGGTTGLTFAGGPITSSGTLTLAGVLGSNNGGAGAISGILKANGSGVVSAATAGTDYLAPGSLSAGTGIGYNSGTGVISNTGVLSVTNADGSLKVSPTTGNAVVSLNTANPNTFTALQTFNAGANSSQFNVSQYGGYYQNGNLLGYASSTNEDTVFGLNSDGNAPTSSGVAGNTSVGDYSLQNNTTGTFNTALGFDALTLSTAGTQNVGIGLEALAYNSGSNDIGIGSTAGYGFNGAYSDTGTIVIGDGDGAFLRSASDDNTFVGTYAGPDVQTGTDNVFLGANTASPINFGSNNIGIGYGALSGATDVNNQLNIGNTIYGTLVATSTIGTYTPVRIGIATTTPGATLSVGAVTGVTEFEIGSSAKTNFIVGSTGNVGVGTTTPGSLFAVNGIANFATGTSTLYSGLNLASGGCYAVNGVCVGTNSGTVTSVNASGGTTGLTFAGGPITSSGTLTLAGVLSSSNGGAGAVNGLLKANGSGVVSAATAGTDYLAPGSLSAGTGIGYSGGVISNTGVLSITNADGSLNVSPTTGNAVVSLNTANPNTFTALQQFNGNASTTQLTVNGQSYFNNVTTSGAENVIGTETVGNLINNGITANSLVYVNGSKQESAVTIGTGLSLASGTLTNTGATSLTTTGTSGAATLTSGVLNIPQYQAAGTYVTGVSIASANGLAGTSSGGATPTLTLSTTVSGLLKGNGTSISAATAGTDYLAPGSLSAGAGIGYNSSTGVISNSGVLSITNADGSLNVSPNTGNAVVSLNTANPNTFTALQQFNGNASTTQLTATGNTYLATAGGYVGIGTSTPVRALDVAGNGELQSQILIEDNNPIVTANNHYYGIQVDNGVFNINAVNDNYSTSTAFTINQNNNVGIGTTSPYAQLSIMAGTDFGNDPASTLFAIGSSTAGHATTTLFAINSAGALTLDGPNAGILNYAGASGNGLELEDGGANRISVAYAENFTAGAIGNSVGAATNGLYYFAPAAQTSMPASLAYYPVANFNFGISRQRANGAVSNVTDFVLTPSTETFATGATIPTSTIASATAMTIFGDVGAGALGNITNDYGLFVEGSTTGNVASTTNSYGLAVQANANAQNNYAAEFLGGNVGIGTTSPYALLSVAGNAVITGTATLPALANPAGSFLAVDSNGNIIATTTPSGGGGGGGTVTSINASGGTTGLTFAGGPITTSGTLTLAGVLGSANGGAGAVSGILKADGAGNVSAATAGTDYLAPGSLSAGAGINYNSGTGVISNTGVLSVTNADGSITVSGTATNPIASLNTGHANTFTALQQFNGNASTTELTTTGATYLATAGGNVGIGTTTPGSVLSVAGTAYVSGIGTFGGVTIPSLANPAGSFLAVNAAGQIIATTTPSGGGGGSGTVGTGTTGDVPFYAANGTTLTATSSLFVDQYGDLGVDTTSPGATLDVNGDINTSATGGYYQGGYLLAYASSTSGFTVLGVDAGIAGLTSGSVYSTAVGASALQSSTGNFNTGIGGDALYNNTSGTQNTAVGYGSLLTNSTASGQSALGYDALFDSTGANNTAVGSQALFINSTGVNNTALGYNALKNNTTGTNNVGLGYAALFSTTGATSGDTAVGSQALYTNSSGANNTAIGTSALYSNTSGNYNTAVGYGSLLTNSTASGQSALGYDALFDSTGPNNTAVGSQALFINSAGVDNTALGYNALKNNTTGNSNVGLGYAALFSTTGSASDDTAVGGSALYTNSSGAYNTAIGTSALNSNTSGNYNTAVGYVALFSNTGANNTAVGYGSLLSNTTASNNTAVGYQSLYTNSTGTGEAALGYGALYHSTGNYNTAVGSQALYTNSTGAQNTATGYFSQELTTTGSNNTSNGYYAGYGDTTGGNNSSYGTNSLYHVNSGGNNTGLGYDSLYTATTGGGNVAVGNNSGYSLTIGGDNILIGDTVNAGGNEITTGSNNIGLGYNAVFPSATANNQFNIGNSIFGTLVATSTSTALPTNFSAVRFGIATSSPTSTLTVAGSACISAGTGTTLACGTTPGNIYYTTANTGNYDVAENYVTNDSTVTAGTIVAVDPNNAEYITTATPGSTILGVISTAPGVELGGADSETEGLITKPVALSGRIPVKVTVAAGDIQIGDRIALSNTPGVGQKSVSSGQTVGIALQNAYSDGTIDVFVQPQYTFAPGALSLNNTTGNVTIGAATGSGSSNTGSSSSSSSSSSATTSDKLTVDGDADIAGNLTAQTISTSGTVNAGDVTVLSLSSTTPADVLSDAGTNGVTTLDGTTGGVISLAKFTNYTLNSLNNLATQTTALATQTNTISTTLQSLTSRVVALENETNMSTTSLAAAVADAGTSSTTSSTSGDLATTTIMNALSSMGVLIEKGITQFNTLVVRDLVFSKDSDGTSAAGSGSILAGNTTVQITNSHMLASSQVSVTLTSPMTGNWYVTNKQDGSFQVTMSQAQTADVTFDYLIIQTSGQIATSTPIGATNVGSFSVSSWLASLFGGPSTTSSNTSNTPTNTSGSSTGSSGSTGSSTGGESGTGSSSSTPDTIMGNASSTPSSSKPTVTLNGAGAISVDQGGVFTDPGATATDASGANISSSIVVSGTVDTNTAGMYTVTYTATDSAGNTGSVSRVVTVSASAPITPTTPAPATPTTPPSDPTTTDTSSSGSSDTSSAAAGDSATTPTPATPATPAPATPAPNDPSTSASAP